ncbi:HAD superfamily hydrolase (TIGR01509 family) [Streptosporangium becharense]|uniref:HAD superfamily hydrolase (TIGR01509 family) n=1 Tax=Streptosporangium becharense TaxID=1816182 RepID=A0A7W9MI89_9ACTN|nr:HAD family phosphatase [Streptosporangium becharense]MBB2910990.1 HAD superfamily hydrolase (TIGR01509 family) [Streptosporangium becharense]MBB5821952.1 HAD superfamily hydrolase (TIGR01509 family) [Streptosporangium becharense]
MSAELRAVLFDMDGTLVDTEGMWWEACLAVAAELGVKLTPADADEVFGRPVGHVAAHLTHLAHLARLARLSGAAPAAVPAPARVRVPAATPASVRAPEGSEGEAGIGARLTEAFAERIAGGVTPLPGAIRLLDELGAHGVPVALVTASPRRIVDAVLRTVGAERFALVVAAEDTARGKPLPDPYLKAARDLGVDPAGCVAVEDSPTGLAAAHAAGCRVISVAGHAPPGGALSVDGLETVNLPLLRLLARGGISIG